MVVIRGYDLAAVGGGSVRARDGGGAGPLSLGANCSVACPPSGHHERSADPWPIPAHRAPRSRRERRGLARARRTARPAGRGQAAAPAPPARRVVTQAPGGGGTRGGQPVASGDRGHLRRRRHRRCAGAGHGARGWRVAQRPHRAIGSARATRGGEHGGRHRRGALPRAPARRGPSRCQAGKRAARVRRPHQIGRLRHRPQPGRVGRAPDDDRHGRRNDECHGARAAARRADHPAHRPVRDRRRAVRGTDRTAAVPRRIARGAGGSAARRTTAARRHRSHPRGDRRRVPGSRAREPAAARGCAGGRVALVAGGRRGAGDCHGTNRDASLGRRHRCRHDGGRRAGCGADRPRGCCSRSTTEGSLSSRPAARRLRPCSAPR